MNISEMNAVNSLTELADKAIRDSESLIAVARDFAQMAMAEDKKLRRLLAIAYSGAKLYGDDGELQDNSEFPFIDFARDSADEIEAAMRARAMKHASVESDRSFAHRWGRQYP